MAREITDEDLGAQVSLTWTVREEKTLTLDVGEWAELLGIKPKTVLDMLARGDMPKPNKKAWARLAASGSHDYQKQFLEVHSSDREVTEFHEV